MQKNNIDRVHRLAELLVYDLELPDSVRHPVRFFFVNDILRATGELIPKSEPTPALEVTQPIPRHTSTCNCRFCATGLFDTCVLKRTLP